MIKPLQKTVEVTDQLVGKTIKSVIMDYNSCEVILRFEDDTFIIFEIQQTYEEPDIVWGGNKIYGHDLVKIGLMTEEEFAEELRKISIESKKEQEALDRAKYEELKKKYETE